MTRTLPDLSLYLVIGAGDTRGRALDKVVAAAVAGGVSVVQLREKTAPTRDILARAEALKQVLDPRGVPLIVNDRLDVALAVGAAGVHLGQDDMPPEAARRLIGPEMLLGLSVSDAAEAARADPAVVDYVGIGAAYTTGTKADAGAAIGAEGVARLRAQVRLPGVAIGGIHAENVAALRRTGIEGVAVVSAIARAADPAAAARDLRAAFLT
jgi:thiamine-phosphate pyrophosphorylase